MDIFGHLYFDCTPQQIWESCWYGKNLCKNWRLEKMSFVDSNGSNDVMVKKYNYEIKWTFIHVSIFWSDRVIYRLARIRYVDVNYCYCANCVIEKCNSSSRRRIYAVSESVSKLMCQLAQLVAVNSMVMVRLEHRISFNDTSAKVLQLTAINDSEGNLSSNFHY